MHLSQEEVEVLQRIDLPRRLGLDDPALPFTAGLLHDVGKVTMAHAYPGLFPLILSELEGKKWREPMLAAEAAVAGGFTHVDVGEMLARKWHLGNRLVGAITYHHDPVAGEPCSFLVGIASSMARAGAHRPCFQQRWRPGAGAV